MNKAELISQMAETAGITKAQAGESLNTFCDCVRKTLKKKGGKVTLVGFGTFSISERKARVGINPQTKEKIKIPKKRVVKFKAGKEFAEYV